MLRVSSLQSDKSRTSVTMSLMGMFKAKDAMGQKLNLSSSVQSYGFGKVQCLLSHQILYGVGAAELMWLVN